MNEQALAAEPQTMRAIPVTLWARLTARVRTWFEIPYGYEDANGFHYGHEPAPQVFTDRACDAMTYPVAASAPPAEAPAKQSAPTVTSVT